MRKNSARRWLHFALDLLPIILIPVFMIYSHRHVLTETKDVDIQYKYQSNEVVDLYTDCVVGNIYYVEEFGFGESSPNVNVYLLSFDSFSVLDSYNTIDYNFDGYYSANNENYVIFSYQTNRQVITFHSDSYETSFDFDGDLNTYFTDAIFYCDNAQDLNTFVTYLDNSWAFPEYTDYNVIESVTVQDTNSDIMSVFINNFNTCVDNYFNFDNVFNFGQIKAWLTTNIFSGSMPAVINSVWQIFCYEFLMDLIFLLYALFMFFIDFCTNIIDRFHTKCKGGD